MLWGVNVRGLGRVRVRGLGRLTLTGTHAITTSISTVMRISSYISRGIKGMKL